LPASASFRRGPSSFFEDGLRLGIGLGRKRAGFQALESQALEQLADLGLAATDAGQLFDGLSRFGDRVGRVLGEVLADRVGMFVEFAGRAARVPPLEALDSASLEVPQPAPECGAGYANQFADILLQESLGLEEHGLHFPLHPWVRVVEPFECQLLDLLVRELDCRHPAASWQTRPPCKT